MYSLLKIGEDIETLPKKKLLYAFKFLYGQEPRDCKKYQLIKACKYLVQDKYYETIFKKPLPENVKIKTQELIKECL